MKNTVNLTYTIINRGQNSCDRTENMKDFLSDLYDVIEYYDMKPRIVDLRYVSTALIGDDDILTIELNPDGRDDVGMFRDAIHIAYAMGDVRDTRIDRTIINNMFIALKMDVRTTEDTCLHIGKKILTLTDFQRDAIESIDVEEGTIFYLMDRNRMAPRKLWDITPSDLENLVDSIDEYFDVEMSPKFQWVIMDRDIKISYHQVSL